MIIIHENTLIVTALS